MAIAIRYATLSPVYSRSLITSTATPCCSIQCWNLFHIIGPRIFSNKSTRIGKRGESEINWQQKKIVAARTWLSENCLKIIASFTWENCPLRVPIYPEELLTTKARDNARKILRCVKHRHVPSIHSAVEYAYNKVVLALPTYARDVFKRTGWQDFLRERYYSIIAKVLERTGYEHKFVFKPLLMPEKIDNKDARIFARK